jgi:hypothetical protein
MAAKKTGRVKGTARLWINRERARRDYSSH